MKYICNVHFQKTIINKNKSWTTIQDCKTFILTPKPTSSTPTQCNFTLRALSTPPEIHPRISRGLMSKSSMLMRFIHPPSHHYSSAGSGFQYIAGVATRLSLELSLSWWSGVEEACWFYAAIGGLFACIPFLLCNLFVGNSAYVFIVDRMIDRGRSLMLWRFSYHLINILFLFGFFFN